MSENTHNEKKFLVENICYVIKRTHSPGYTQHVSNRTHTTLYYILDGRMDFYDTNNNQIDLFPGGFCFLDKGARHTIKNHHDDKPVTLFLIGFDLLNPSDKHFDFDLPTAGNLPLGSMAHKCIEALLSCYEKQHFAYTYKLNSLFYNLIYIIQTNRRFNFDFLAKEHIKLNEVLHYINRNYKKDIKIEDLLKICNYSESYFRKIFAKCFKMSPVAYIRMQRIEEAKRLLSGTDLPISEISYSIGYEDVNYFHRVFKKLTNQTPSEYRKEIKDEF